MTIRPRHYARLLLTGASSEVATKRLLQLRTISKETRSISRLITNPQTTKLVDEAFDRLGVEPIIRNLAKELAATRRLSWLSSIERTMEEQILEKGLAVPVKVTVAHESIDKDALNKELEAIFGQVSDIEISIDPNQLGGIEIKVSDRKINTRLDDRLKKLRLNLRKAK